MKPKFLTTLLSVVLCTIIAQQNSKGQSSASIPEFICSENPGPPLPLPSGASSVYGGVHTPKGNLHFLVIFVGFNSDISQFDIGTPGQNDYWAVNDIPNWAKGASSDIFDNTPSTIGTRKI